MPFIFSVETSTLCFYTLSLHDALPISLGCIGAMVLVVGGGITFLALNQSGGEEVAAPLESERDRKSTRLNSSHVAISYAVFCLKKKIKKCCVAFCLICVYYVYFVSDIV